MVFATKKYLLIHKKGSNFVVSKVANYTLFEGSFELSVFRCKAGFHFMHPWLQAPSKALYKSQREGRNAP